MRCRFIVGTVFFEKNFYKMKKKIIRTDLMSKSEYSKQYGISRPTVDKKIENGELVVEVISGVEYVKIA